MGQSRTRQDGRKSLLVYLRPDVIKDVKKAGLDEDRPVYAIAEEALSAWLAKRSRMKAKKGSEE